MKRRACSPFSAHTALEGVSLRCEFSMKSVQCSEVKFAKARAFLTQPLQLAYIVSETDYYLTHSTPGCINRTGLYETKVSQKS